MTYFLPISSLPGYFAEPETGSIWSNRRGALKKLSGGFSKGYRIYSVMKDGRQVTRYGHRMVAEAVLGPCPANMECCHRNGDRQDNRARNLRWASASENNGPDKLATGRLRYGEHHQNSKLTRPEVDQIRIRRMAGDQLSRLSKDFGVAEATVSRIALGKAWVK